MFFKFSSPKSFRFLSLNFQFFKIHIPWFAYIYLYCVFFPGYCETYFETFASLCMGIAGDSPMYSMFRKEGKPVRCPFKGPFTFRYTKGGSGSMCGYPLSYLDSCTDNTKLQVNFQACIDVQGSEASAEEFQCLATWKEGYKRYMVAEMNRDHVYSDESKYRCFVYEKHGKGDNQTVHMAQSVAATCNGLWSPTEGFRTFDMIKGKRYLYITKLISSFYCVSTTTPRTQMDDKAKTVLSQRWTIKLKQSFVFLFPDCSNVAETAFGCKTLTWLCYCFSCRGQPL